MHANHINRSPRHEYHRQYYKKNRDKVEAYKRAWREKNMERLREWSRKYYHTNEKYRRWRKSYYHIWKKKYPNSYKRKMLKGRPIKMRYAKLHRKEIRLYHRQRYMKTKLDVLMRYSPNLICKLCGYDDKRALTIHHLEGGGNKHALSLSNHLYEWLQKNNYPKGYQVLCFNCNWLEAHKRAYFTKWYENYKKNIFKHYSPMLTCAKCGYPNLRALTIDHIMGGGTKHVHGIKGTFYNWLRKHNYPSGFQVLCFNCNHIKHVETGK